MATLKKVHPQPSYLLLHPIYRTNEVSIKTATGYFEGIYTSILKYRWKEKASGIGKTLLQKREAEDEEEGLKELEEENEKEKKTKVKTEEGEGRFLLSVSVHLWWFSPCGMGAPTDTSPTQGIWPPETDCKYTQLSYRTQRPFQRSGT